MKGKWALISSLLAVLLLALGTGLTQAQGPQEQVSIQATVGGEFTYQGRLTDGGSPANGIYDFEFKLYDDATGGAQVGSTVTMGDHTVTEGLFTVPLDFGDVFYGTALWLEIGVRPGSSTGAYTTLSPRQALTAAPYALSLRPGADIRGTLDNNAALYIRNDGSGIAVGLWAVSVNAAAVYGQSTHGIGLSGVGGNDSIGTQGWNTGSGIGVNGYSGSGQGVRGVAGASSGTTYGVYGQSQSPDGFGGFFENTATSAPGGRAVYGVAHGPGGIGVQGYAYASTGGGVGVWGQTNAPNGSGVAGWGFSTSGGHGVYANSRAPGGEGAAIYAQNIHANGIAIWGKAQGTDSTMVLEHTAGSGEFIRAFQTDPGELRFALRHDGWGFADGGWTTPASDFAEMLPAVEGLEPGDVLVVAPDGNLTRSSQPYQPTVVGVYSTRPGFVAGQPVEGGPPEGHIPLALVGVVPVKASTENGPISPGDLLVASSVPGHAMRAGPNPPIGTVIGKALEGLDQGTGVVQMLVMLQ